MIIDIRRVELFLRCAKCDRKYLESVEVVMRAMSQRGVCMCISCDPSALEVSCLRVTKKGAAELAQ
jgi:hypothetical protein